MPPSFGVIYLFASKFAPIMIGFLNWCRKQYSNQPSYPVQAAHQIPIVPFQVNTINISFHYSTLFSAGTRSTVFSSSSSLSLSSRTHLFRRLRDFKWSTPSGVKNPTCFGAKDSFFFSDGFSFQNPPGKILISPRYSPFSPSLFLHSLPYCSFLSLLES